MAKLLRSGYTMLNYSCPQCNNPIFKEKESNRYFCPICNQDVKFVEKDELENINDINIQKNNSQSSSLSSDLEKVLNQKESYFSKKLLEENDLILTHKYLKIIKEILELRKYLEINF